MLPELIGYSASPSAAPGDTVAFKISTDLAVYDATVVRLIHGDRNGPGFKEEVVGPLGNFKGRKQETSRGSFVAVADSHALALASLTLTAFIMPTTAEREDEQGIFARISEGGDGYALLLRGGYLVFRIRNAGAEVELVSPEPLRSRQWYFVAASVSVDGAIALRLDPISRWPMDKSAAAHAQTEIRLPQLHARLTMAALSVEEKEAGRLKPAGLYNGRIEAPTLFGRVLSDAEIDEVCELCANENDPALVAAWDFSERMDTAEIIDIGRNNLHGVAINMPTRAVTGSGWASDAFDFTAAPDEYGAIHFHDDDIEDAGWSTEVEWQVPPTARSGFYALRLNGNGAEDHIPFFVKAASGSVKRPKALVLAPTFTYLAYACERLTALERHAAVYPKRPMVMDPLDHYLLDHPEFGNSLYDVHSDGSGWCYSTWRRPITSMRPKYRQWQVAAPRHLGADLYLIDWLEAHGFDYDVATDHDLHAEGAALLADYKVMITGTHPEYWSTPMLDALEAYLDRGGRHMYLGGNGYYWVTGRDHSRPHVVEVRRGNAGSRAWNSGPGELYLSTTGEMGGLWRYRGRPPNRVAGIGFAAQGYDAPTPGYRRASGSSDPRAAFIFDGIGEDEIIGNFGLYLGGAAGDEIDRLNYELGTPPHALLLASATGHDPSFYMPVVDDYGENSAIVIEAQAKTVGADIVYFETKEGGAVFSAGAISWCGSLSYNGYDNNVSRITANVLRRFLA